MAHALAVTFDSVTATAPYSPCEKREAGFDAPTMAEAGVRDLVVYSWQAVAAPKGLPADVKAKLDAALSATLKDAEVSKRLVDMGFEVVGNTSAQFDALVEVTVNSSRNRQMFSR
jgi:tripartite-type tricarboxylate transporter receptor subunit TctC